MLNSIEISSYQKRDSFLHSLDAFYKILYYILFILISTFSNQILFHIFYIIWIMLLMYFSKIETKLYFKMLKHTKILLISVFIINALFQVPIVENILGIVKIIEILVYSFILMFTTNQLQMIRGIYKLLTPLKVFHIPVEEIAIILSLALSFFSLIIEQANRILKALSIRGLEYKYSKGKSKFLIIRSMLIPMFVLTLKKADSIADMMEIRMYNNFNTCGKTVDKCVKIQKIEKILLVIHIFLWISVLFMR